ncbi:kinase-like domain-containing protein [Rhizophagus diaphanus]|nr:kinase-like domain-containing protein [Rhizophagus diaphanus] [Rhizophagus sp. MUCL 43196]
MAKLFTFKKQHKAISSEEWIEERMNNGYIHYFEYDKFNQIVKIGGSLSKNNKIQMALDITSGLKFLHFNEIIHRDLHSRNILVNNGKLLIVDFKLSEKMTEAIIDSIANRSGMIEYSDPQCFKNREYKKNKKSDIYSLGVLLWEISSGHPPFSGHSKDILAFHISYNNLREGSITGIPPTYQKLYQKCWDNKPKSRPDIEEVYEILNGGKGSFGNIDHASWKDTEQVFALKRFNGDN